MIQLQRLEGFYWVAKTQGYARAARAFSYPITQPGVHQQVTRLEADLGVKLFERVAKDRMLLTPRGQTLYDFVAPFFERLPEVERAVRTGSKTAGTLRIDTSTHLLRYLLPPWLRRLQGRAPDMNLELTEAKTADVSRLRSGEADLLVDYLPRVPKDLASKKVGVAKAFLVIASHHPLAREKKTELSLRDLAEETFIAYGTDRQSRELQLKALQTHGIAPKRIHSAESAETILGFVAVGLGYSIVPSVLPHGPRDVGLVAEPLVRPAAQFPIYALWRKSSAGHPLVELALSTAP